MNKQKHPIVREGDHAGRDYVIVETPNGNYRCSFRPKRGAVVNMLPRNTVEESYQAMVDLISQWDSMPLI